jgi:hypothetical protein
MASAPDDQKWLQEELHLIQKLLVVIAYGQNDPSGELRRTNLEEAAQEVQQRQPD